ncbi:right-handed parallel beta-helix repeat-containing protein [Aeoliella sp. SH292]|uniref:right-handed parallel beta-helix repeat-containing protein n=1 Tax=Aeoliella sp. SH292 TaxID=3454464 RepID=UPI003F9465F8
MAGWNRRGRRDHRKLRFEGLEVRNLLSITIYSDEIWDGVSNPRAADGVTLANGHYTIPTDITIAPGVTVYLDDPTPSPADQPSGSITWSFAPNTGGLFFGDATSTIDVSRGGRNLAAANFTLNMNNNMLGGSSTGAGRIINGDYVTNGTTGDSLSVVINSRADIVLGTIDLRVNDATTARIEINSEGLVDINYLANADTSAGGSSTRDIDITGERLLIGDIDTRAYRTEANVGNVHLRALQQPVNSIAPTAGNSVVYNTITLTGTINTNGPPNTLSGGGDLNLTAAKVVLAETFSANLSEHAEFEISSGMAGGGFTQGDVFVNRSASAPDLLSYSVAHVPVFPGDANADGVVGLADYTVWRDTLGSQVQLSADFDRSGKVDVNDYTLWKSNFGMTVPEDEPYDSVRFFGAQPNDSTYDSQAIQRAIDANETVYLPAGEYWLDSKLRLPAGRKLYGPSSGPPAVLRVRFDTGSTTDNYAIEITGDGVVIQDLAIDKDFIDGSYAVGIIANNRSDITIAGVEIQNYSVRYGIHLIECSDFVIDNCYVHDFLMNQSNPNGYESDMIQDSPAGIRVTRSINGSITNNRIHNIDVGPLGRASISELVPSYGPQTHQADGITLSDCSYVLVEFNSIWNSGELVDILVSDNITLRNNTLQMAYGLGVKVIGSQDSLITQNYIADAAVGIWVGDHSAINQSVGNEIIDNDLVNTGSRGIWNIAANNRLPIAISGIYVDNNAELTSVSDNRIYNSLGYTYIYIREGSGNNTFSNNAFITEQFGPASTGDAAIIGDWAVGLTHEKELIALNRALVFFTYAEDADADVNATAVTYGGRSLTKLNDRLATADGVRTYVSAWILLQDQINMAAHGQFAVTWNTTPDSVNYSSVFATNIYQPQPIRDQDSGTQEGGSTINTSPRSTEAGDLVLVAATVANEGTFTAQHGFIKAQEIALSGADGFGGYKIATGGDEFGSATHTHLGSGVMYMGILQKNPSPAVQKGIDVTTLGIIPNDGVDDSVALQNALNTALEDSFYFPPGTYHFGQHVFIPSNKTLRGDEVGVSKLETLTDTVIFRVDGESNITVSNFTMERPQTQNSNNEIIRTDLASDLVFEHLHILDSASRAPIISLLGGSDNTVRDSLIENYQVVRSEESPEQPGLHDQVFGVGVNFVGNSNVTVQNNRVIQSTPVAIDFETAVIKGVHQSSAIQVIASVGGAVTDNYVSMTGQGMDLGSSSFLTVAGNFIDEIHSAGIKLVNGSNNNVVEGNYLRNNGLTGIWVSAGVASYGGSFDNLIQDNILVGIGQGFGLDFWDTNFALSTPAAIHLQAAQVGSDRVRNNTIINNRSYDNDEQRGIVVAESSNSGSPFEAYINVPSEEDSNTVHSNIEDTGLAPDPPSFGIVRTDHLGEGVEV